MAPASPLLRLARRAVPLAAISVLGCAGLVPHGNPDPVHRIAAQLGHPTQSHQLAVSHGPLYAGASAPLRAGIGADALTSPLPGASRAVLAGALDNARVRDAFVEKDASLRAAFAAQGLPYLAGPILLRAFKRERQLQVWVREPAGTRYVLLRTYGICTLGVGGLGPKERAGDEHVPEGFYHVTSLNPDSRYYLSLRLDYPNAADLERTGGHPGGDIYVHGGCRTAGCLPLTNDAIKELYWLVAQERAAGWTDIPIHIYPTRLDEASMAQLARAFPGRPKLLAFWRNLKEAYDSFEASHRLAEIESLPGGRYLVAGVRWRGQTRAPRPGVKDAQP